MEKEMYKKNVGLIGCGLWGKNILRNLYELGVLHSVYDKDYNLLEGTKKKFPDLFFKSHLVLILNNPEIKAVVIATPASSHYKIAKQLLLANKDVFVEKPLSLSVAEGEELINIARDKDKIIMVGHILQYHPAVIKLKEEISKGTLGKIQYIYSNRLNLGKLRTDENVLWSFAPHDISVILFLLNKEPVFIKCFGGDYLKPNVFDTTLTTLDFYDNVKAHIFVSWLHPYKEQKLIVVGSKSMVVFNDMNEEKLIIYKHKIKWKNGEIPYVDKANYQVISFDNKEPLKEELIHFVKCITDRITPKTDGYEGLKVLKVIEAAENSVKNHEKVINHHTNKKYFSHESSYVDENAKIGKDTKIWHFSHILKNSQIGKNCVIGQNVMIGPDVIIGNNCKIQNNVSIYKGVTLKDDVFCGPSCVFTNVRYPRAFVERKDKFTHTYVGTGATIGANSTILCGIIIGDYAMIGAGAVVISDVFDHALVVGVPAKRIGWVCRCGAILECDVGYYRCFSCRNKYDISNNIVSLILDID